MPATEEKKEGDVASSSFFHWASTCFRVLPEHTGQGCPISDELLSVLQEKRGVLSFEQLQLLFSRWETSRNAALADPQTWHLGEIANCVKREIDAKPG